MAKKIIQQLVDDLDGSLLEDGAGDTILFSLDGIAYEIDLSDANAAALRDALASYVAAGRRVSRTGSASATPTRRSRTRGGAVNENAAIREWAGSNGYSISSRGRIPENVVVAYNAAN
ncbi:histone-like nucleoid-structuring protein Lsr2 [Microbacterium rhizosphaerae]|uniref:Lsr2 family protein n=1 Tax=Microbacterium rhizosphaerae TaxID=1678237 RepID=A0ABZ0SQU2_9MICO|nr:Lsr2 family protein [Microbacterium rhizosphaerae]WPR91329.1 Lsr2 family protein [Microbacterium rhizosphaerae]